jgi:hypothetical protein
MDCTLAAFLSYWSAWFSLCPLCLCGDKVVY